MVYGPVKVQPSSQEAEYEPNCWKRCYCVNVFVSCRVKENHQENVTVLVSLRHVVCTIKPENQPHMVQHLLSKRGECCQGKVLMLAEVKVICQQGQMAGWLRCGNWQHWQLPFSSNKNLAMCQGSSTDFVEKQTSAEFDRIFPQTSGTGQQW